MGAPHDDMFSLLLRHIWLFLQRVGKILHRLWLEITGTVFLGLAAFGALSALKEWRAYQSGGALWELVAAVCFVLMMGGFGIYSFLKAWRMR